MCEMKWIMTWASCLSFLYPWLWVCDTTFGACEPTLQFWLTLTNCTCVENKFKIEIFLIQKRWYLDQSCTSPKEESKKNIVSVIWVVQHGFGPYFPNLTFPLNYGELHLCTCAIFSSSTIMYFIYHHAIPCHPIVSSLLDLLYYRRNNNKISSRVSHKYLATLHWPKVSL